MRRRTRRRARRLSKTRKLRGGACLGALPVSTLGGYMREEGLVVYELGTGRSLDVDGPAAGEDTCRACQDCDKDQTCGESRQINGSKTAAWQPSK